MPPVVPFASVVTKPITDALGELVASGRDELQGFVDKFLFSTVNTNAPSAEPFTNNQALRSLHFGMVAAVDILIAAVIIFNGVRAVTDRAAHSHYSLKMMLPKLLIAFILIHFGLPLMQMAIDLNNGLSGVAANLGAPLHSEALPWAAPLGAAALQKDGANLFHLIFGVALVVGATILALAYVLRYALLNVLVVLAPLAALCSVLPETRSYSRAWGRLFAVTVFMQAIQLLVLRTATTISLTGDGVASSLYGIATLYLMLKVPGALNAASHMETRAHTLGHHLEGHLGKTLRRVAVPVHHVTRRTAS